MVKLRKEIFIYFFGWALTKTSYVGKAQIIAVPNSFIQPNNTHKLYAPRIARQTHTFSKTLLIITIRYYSGHKYICL